MSAKGKVSSYMLNKAMNYISNEPEKNIPKLLKWVDALGLKQFENQSKVIHGILDDPENNWYKFIMGLWNDIDNETLKVFFRNFGLNANLLSYQKNEELEAEHGCNIPMTMLIDPTSACNLKCTGCWAAEYGNQLNMSYDTLNDIIRQGKELSIYFYLYSGGEPLVRKDDLIRLCDEHPDSQFAAFTNGTLIDAAFVEELKRVKNFVPIISVEGFEEETDFRRGKGTFAKVEKAMALLRENRLPFGVSCCYTSKNVETIGSEAYFDQMVAWGAKFCWLFTYMPVGNEAVPELMVTDEQRAFMYQQVRKFRETKPLFILDFWNDGEYAGGCVAGGRRYLHINANGDIEPCAFVHYSDSSIYEKSILEALKSPLFMAYRKGQPFNENHLRPCPLLDNPEKLVDMVDRSGAHSTDLQDPEDVRKLAAKCEAPSERWGIKADALWEVSHGCAGCSKCHADATGEE